jgi:hypothetical protein
MFTEQNLFELHRDRGIVQVGELYLPIDKSFGFLDDCQGSDLAIIGIEGFILQNQNIVPLLDAIADFSSVDSRDWKTYQATCNKAAECFLKEMNNDERNLLFNFVVESKSEWETERTSKR